MSRYASPQISRGQPTYEGDSSFVGLDMETSPWLLPPGHYAKGQNARCASGHLGKRAGVMKPLWANVAAFAGGILGSGIFSNPRSDTPLLLIATPPCVWKVASGGYPSQIALAADTTLAGPIEFAQKFGTVQLHQGDRGPTLEWDGDPAHAFKVIEKAHPDVTTTAVVPNVDWSTEMAGRSIFPLSRDEFGVGDANDSTSWDPAPGIRTYRANPGTSDTLTGLFPYAAGNLIIGKRNSIDVFQGFTGTLENISAQMVSSSLGIFARRSWMMLGSDALFLSRRGVYRLSQVDQNRLQTSPTPVAASRDAAGRVVDPIAPLLRRINWEYAHLAVAGLDGPYYALAVPIDGSTVNNAIFWLNTISEKWEGYDVYDPAGRMQIDNLLSFPYLGEQRLFAVNQRTSTIHLLNEGKEDQLFGRAFEIDMDVTTRGFATLGWNATTKRDFKRVVIPVRTLRPMITIEEQPEGAGDSRPLTKTPITRSRTKYTTFGKKPYVTTNANDDFSVPGREDYSVVLSGTEELHLGSKGVVLDLKQESVLGGPGGFSTKCRGRSISYRIRCTEGDCDVLGVLVESDGSQRETRQAA